MTSIVKNKIGKYIYLYESESYRDKNGKPQTRKVSIGKIDPQTGNPIYKPEYLARAAGTTKQQDFSNEKLFSEKDIKESQIREYGAFYLMEAISAEIGLTNTLKSVLPETWEKALILAFYMIASGEPAMYCEDWLRKTESLPCKIMSSQNISKLLSAISNAERMAFFEKWGELRNEKEYLALDITSISSYSEFIDDIKWGYNRDKQRLNQINVCLLMGAQSRLPVFQTTYSGSLKDLSTLKTTFQLASGIKLRNLSLVLDQGFGSKKIIDAMLESQESIRFLVAVPFTMAFAKNQADRERKDIDSIADTIVIGDDIIQGITKERAWSPKYSLFTHIFYNAELAYQNKNRLYRHVAKLQAEVSKGSINPNANKEIKKYLTVRKSERSASGYTVNIRDKVVENQLRFSGWLVIVSNHIDNASEAIEIYHHKDVVEKCFLRMKNCLDLGRLKGHRDGHLQNKLFIGFIGLIVMVHIHKVMTDNNMYESMTLKTLIKTLERLRVQHIKGKKIVYPITAEQKNIFDAFGISYPM
ncbi:MAG: transposase [Deltaproteobacteria bacterium]|jgi:transposase|nr:transposase [Deltaproteobacteria bacterium]